MADKIAKKPGIRQQLGGLSKRFFDPSCNDTTPGPGSYLRESEAVTHQNSRRKNRYHPPKFRKANAVFISKTKRDFGQPKDEAPATGLYDSHQMTAFGNGSRVERGGGTSLFRFLRLNPGKRPVFQSASPRFSEKSICTLFALKVAITTKIVVENIPGPCYYNVKPLKDKGKVYISQLADRGSFLIENFTPGPGSYTKQKANWGKRSFNIKYIK